MAFHSLLEGINSPQDLQKLSYEETYMLCGEIRKFLLDNVSRTGGHLASNLGIVELSVAIEKIFHTNEDRVVYDVGHQSYVHKILTGRRDAFSTLRSYGGLSGFMRPDESSHDPFVTGHASNSISAVLGMARAARLQGRHIHCVAVIGDGALTGGLAYEALNDAGATRERIIVILNDNGMSIDKNVGAIARYLAHARIRRQYLTAKKRYHMIMNKIPGGERINNGLTRLKNRIKAGLLPGTLFEQLGFVYIGPIDGHNLKDLCHVLEAAQKIEKPVLIHVITKKGKGYSFSEDNPQDYHGVTKFDTKTGRDMNNGHKSFSTVFGDALCRAAEKDGTICAVTAAMPESTGLSVFRSRFPERCFDVGIAEAHAVTMSAGLASQGMHPVCAVYSSFLQRSFDQLIHDVAIMKLPVVLAVDRAGLCGEDGETHHGVFDIAYLSIVPGMCVYCPSSFAELPSMLARALGENGPAAIRYPKGAEGAFQDDTSDKDVVTLKEGTDITLVSYGIMINLCIETAKILEKHGISAEIIKFNRLPASDIALLEASIKKTRKIAVIEDTMKSGSAAGRLLPLAAGLLERPEDIMLFNLGENFIPQGACSDLYAHCGLTPEAISERILMAVGRLS